MKAKIFRFLLLMAAFMGLAISLQGCGQSEGTPAIGKNQQAQSVPRGEPESGPENLAILETEVAEGAREINGTGFVSADGAYWRVFSDSGEYTGMEKEAHTRWAVYDRIEEDSIRILDDGNIEVRFRESA